jgi:formamidopyrimidine-DNA glycosylase
MPELPEVETVVRGLRSDVEGRTFTRADVRWAREIAVPSPRAFADRIAGQRVEEITRRAKYLVFRLTHDSLLVHLKMTGRLYVAAPDDVVDGDRWLRVMLTMDDGRELRFSESRKFGRMYLVADENEVTGKIGPEPLSSAFTLRVFRERLSRRSGAIKPLLLNQTFLAGVGNIYADESLWRARISPHRAADTLTDNESQELHNAIRKVLEDAIRFEGASVKWYRKPDGTQGESQKHFNVYDQTDKPCPRCGSPIRKEWLAQRGTHYCPACQR